jgi:N-methylhydantoinase A
MAGQHVDGPAVIEQEDTTTLVLAGFRASVDAFGNLVIEGR